METRLISAVIALPATSACRANESSENEISCKLNMSHFNVHLHLNVRAVRLGGESNSDVKQKCIKCSLQLSIPVIHFPDVGQADVTFTGPPN